MMFPGVSYWDRRIRCERRGNPCWAARRTWPWPSFRQPRDQGSAEMAHPGFAASDIDTSRPHPARMYNYFLGGKDNYLVDQEAAREVLRQAPEMRLIAKENRAFLRRAVRYLVGAAGIRQIIDIGTGMCASYCVPFHALCGLGSDVC